MKKKTLILVSALLVVVLGMTLLSSCGKKEPAEPEVVRNPLTGEADYNESAVDVRPAALVVENAPDARPQWGMDDETNPPDIILQGEVEGGITRTLWFYADYTAIPSKIGPMRSARPPYIKFSEMFDAIFVHWGQSTTENGYVGANTVFKDDKVDHINQMSYSGDVDLFSRDSERDVSSEHTGILHGDKLPEAIKEKKFDTALSDKATKLSFNTEIQDVGKKTAGDVTLTWSDRASWEDISWNYDSESGLYKSDAFENNVARENLLILFDKTEYITKSNYHNSGSSVDYCDYKLAGGKAVLISNGTYRNIEWDVNEDNQLELFVTVEDEDADDEEEPQRETVSLNPGKTWIGWASSNNGGKVHIDPVKEEKSEDKESEE